MGNHPKLQFILRPLPGFGHQRPLYRGTRYGQACLRLLDQIAEVGSPIVILTGGEPLLRPDIFEVAQYGTDKGLKMVMAVNGTLVTEPIARKMAASGIKRISISLDAATKERHDAFRGVPGAFEGALRGIEFAKAAGIEFQINTTITKANFADIPKIQELAIELGAVAHHIFLLVPTGRGKYMIDQEISAEEYEETLNWFYDQRAKTSLQLKATCAPHYYRILRQRAKADNISVTFQSHGLDAVTRGCLGGSDFVLFPTRGSCSPAVFFSSPAGISQNNPFRKSGDTRRNSLSCGISMPSKENAARASTARSAVGAGPGPLRRPEISWRKNRFAAINRRFEFMAAIPSRERL